MEHTVLWRSTHLQAQDEGEARKVLGTLSIPLHFVLCSLLPSAGPGGLIPNHKEAD